MGSAFWVSSSPGGKSGKPQDVKAFRKKLEAAKRSSTLHLLFRCSRLLNEQELASLGTPSSGPGPRAAHLSLFPHIDLDEGTRITEMAARLGITKQAVGQLVDELVDMGAVQRVPDPEDARAKRVIFTAAGRQGMLSGLAHLSSLEPQLEEILGKRLLAKLREALLKLHDHLGET